MIAPRIDALGSDPADPRGLAQLIVGEARSRGGLLLFTDYDGTLCRRLPGRREPGLPLLVRGALVALASTPCTRVALVSRRDAALLEASVNVPGLLYAGSRGLVVRGRGMSFCHPAAAQLRELVPAMAEQLAQRLEGLPGVEVEANGLSIAIHARRESPSIMSAVLREVEKLRRTPGGDFRMWPGACSVELAPDADWWKDASAAWILEEWTRELQEEPAVVAIGEDGDGECLDGAVTPTREHAVRIGPPTGETCCARVADQAAAIDLLAQIAVAWSIPQSTS